MSFTDLAEGILEEFAQFSPYCEAEYDAQLRAMERAQAAAERRKEALRMLRAQQRRLVHRECPHCGLVFSFTLPRIDGRIPVFCSRRCGGAVRKGRWLAWVPATQLKLFQL